MPRLVDVEQGSPEWLAARRGVITATRAQAIFGRGQSKWKGFRFTVPLQASEDAIAEIAMERQDHSGKPNVTGAALRRGHDFEDEARDAYTFATGQVVDLCGLALHDDYDLFGCSPDGMVGQRGMMQIKVPTSVRKHVSYLKTGFHAAEYGWQLFHEMFVMERDWTDCVSYCPEAGPGLQLAIHRLYAPRSWKAYRDMLVSADCRIEDVVSELSAIREAA